jgi:hypothetical protein
MNINYVWIGVGIAAMVWALVAHDWLLLFIGFTSFLDGWTRRKLQPAPWVKHPTTLDRSSDTTN